MKTQISQRVRCLAAAALTVSMMLVVPAQAKGKFEGTWKISTPQVSLHAVSGDIPFTPKGKETYEQHKAAAANKDFSFDLTATRCSSPGLPRMMLTPDRFNIFERPGMIMVLFEWNRTFRQIDLRGLPLEPDDEVELRYVGRSVGKWEGNTLVVKSSGFMDDALLDNFLPSSSDLKLSEKIRPVGANTLEDHITITDSQYYSKPWETVVTYTRQPNAIFDQEDICLERLKEGKATFPR